MDGCRARHSRAGIPQKPDQLEETTRPKLGLCEKRNGVPLVCNFRTRETSSGYKTSTASLSIQVVPRRSQSPLFNPKSNEQELKLLRRSKSADRIRPSNSLSVCSRPLTPSSKSSRPSTPTYDSVTEMHSTPRHLLAGRTPDGLWPSMKSLSSSFGLNSTPPQSSIPERKWIPPQSWKTSDLSENSRPVDDLHGRTVEQDPWLGLRSRMISANSSKFNSLITPTRGVLHGSIHDFHVSDKRHKQLKSKVERRVTLDCNGQSKHESCMRMSSPRLCSSEKALQVRKASWRSSSPISRSYHVLPLNKTLSAPQPTLKQISSPSFTSNSTKSRECSTSSVLNYTVEARKGKQGTKRIEGAHQLRMLYNRYLQWRFVNALTEDVLSVQRIKAELKYCIASFFDSIDLENFHLCNLTKLYNMENVSSELCDPFVKKRIYKHHMKQDMKLNMLLIEQITYLEDWAAIENEHCFSLSGTTRALKARTLWIPVTGEARGDIKSLKNAINSAVDAMQAISSSICYLSSKVDQLSSLTSEVLASARKERSMLDDCTELLVFAGELQVHNSSLRAHIMQLGQVLCK
ncbi:hypothetical protein IEQ34_005575 [Dendrobium chrysotoxum]|uniref:Uncharacterized protein n=1 Tax=Dendrobium chrysotoxum TaxID=161865 RepID=A0AAV7HAJ3_DENCH|nr:hypothetical protein IEQ34_005575 [Dendrobium chrysotoxum]